MKLPPFNYLAPQSLEELTRIVAERHDAVDTAILAGGQSLLPLLALRRAKATTLVDINGLGSELGGIGENGGGLQLGALVRQRTAERNASVARRVPLLTEALALCAKPAVRTRGTVVGSLAHADPAAEIPLVALALDAVLTASGPRGDRMITAAEFFVGPFRTALDTDEYLTTVTFPELPEGSASCFLEISPRYADRAVVAVAAAVTRDGESISDVRLALGGVAPTPVRARHAEEALVGQTADGHAIAAAATKAIEDIHPDSDLRASGAYRRHVAGVLASRALVTAIERAGGAA